MWNILRIFSFPFGVFPFGFIRVIWRILDIFDGKGGAILRYILICRQLKSCGKNIYFGPFVFFDDPENISIGSNVSVHNGVTLLAKGGVNIGDNVSIAHGASLVTGNHGWEEPSIPIKYNKVVLKPIYVENDVWIGAGARILAGVHVGSRSIIAANAVVNRNLLSGAIYGGVPAKKLKNII